MRFKTEVKLLEGSEVTPGYTTLRTCVCRVCGKKLQPRPNCGNRGTYTNNWTFNRTIGDDGYWRAASEDATCREAMYNNLMTLSWYVTDVQQLYLVDCQMPVDFRRETPSYVAYHVVEDLANGFWLGLTNYNSRFSYGINQVNVPVELLDWRTNCGGPLYSICGQFFKSGLSQVNKRYVGHNYSDVTTIANNEVVAQGQVLHDLLAVSPNKMSPDHRKDVLRATLDYLWNVQNLKINPWSDGHRWCKYAILWQALGGLDNLTQAQGFLYYRYSGADRLYNSASVREPKRPQLVCNHEDEYREYRFNGSVTFYESFFTHMIDGRSVSRFINGGTGLLEATADKYRRYKPWE